MSAVLDAIETKKAGGEIDAGVLREVVSGFTGGTVADYQMAALLMAIRLRGMSYDETVSLTRIMAQSGPTYSFPGCVDKHSTGGVGDKITLTSLPLVAACGVPVAKLSGRGLGITGGTIDKLESIPGWSGDLSEAAFRRQVEAVGLVVGAAGELAPADKAIYALRDTTGTVDSLPLIGSSIVSKKAATGAGHLLYDVKAGSGAFMPTVAAARELAELLVRLSKALGISASAVITDMSTPLGSAVGNALEVRESVDFLRGEPVGADLAAVAVREAVLLAELHGLPDAQARVEQALTSGAGYEKLAQFVTAQGGDVEALVDMTVDSATYEIRAERTGYVGSMDALGVARASLALGAGRQTKDDPLDFGAGVEILAPVGREVAAGQPVLRLYGTKDVEAAKRHATDAFEIVDEPVTPVPHILDTL